MKKNSHNKILRGKSKKQNLSIAFLEIMYAEYSWQVCTPKV